MNAGLGLSQACHTQSAVGAHFYGLSRNRVSFKTQTGTEPDPIIHVLNHMSIGQKTKPFPKILKYSVFSKRRLNTYIIYNDTN